ncbi:MAG: serine hydrolase domain-containing protein [Actinomycetota bacterium]|nr:serine hydrolase domain-containing protein [Actinomycetota bacterium]MEC9473675.1 serine hydrolase domain-containing protein [Actinomycetota bacterium]MEE3256873.1 serine hydrolase domain-containing protein [Actinomycetota bacterium]
MKLDQVIDNCLGSAVRNGIIPGAVGAVIDKKGIVAIRAQGTRSQGSGDAMTTDTVFQIASMTKPLTGVACLQAVERGLLELDQPAGEIIPQLGDLEVLDSIDESGPTLRPPNNAVTLRNLLTHTSGFTYEVWNAGIAQWLEHTGAPGVASGKWASLQQPLSFEPGQRWEYGIGIDWAGQLLEAVSGMRLGDWMRQEIFNPLGMSDTGYECNPDMQERLAAVHVLANDQWTALASEPPKNVPEFDSGGGGLFSTALDYANFIQMILCHGEFAEQRILSDETVTVMSSNNMGQVRVTPVTSLDHNLSADFEFMPGVPKSWGLTFQINEESVPGGRDMGSLSWAGLFNTHFWIDPTSGFGALLMTQTLPFMLPQVANLLNQLERAIYETATS